MMKLFVATGEGLAQIMQQKDEWVVTRTLTRSGMQCLALDPKEPGTLYAGSRGKGVWKSSDGGMSWRDMSLPQPDVFSLAVSPADGSVYAGCEPSMLFRSSDGGQHWEELAALRSIPSAPTWSFPPRPWTSHVRWIAPNPHEAGLLLVGIELGGLMYSKDSGQTWSDHRPGAQRDVHALVWHPNVQGRAYEAGGGGAAWSHDGGWTWRAADAGRDRHYTWGLPQPLNSFPYALASAPGELYAGLGDGRIYASYDGGDTWRQLALRGEGLPSVSAMVCVK